jgi:hypothetical protein
MTRFLLGPQTLFEARENAKMEREHGVSDITILSLHPVEEWGAGT